MQFLTNHFSMKQAVEILGPWFHNLHLPGGLQTAPEHFLGDFPDCKWQQIKKHIPADLSGWKCLDIGCNAGFYSFELAKRGAEVLGIDSSARYLAQASLAAQALKLKKRPRFEQMQIHDLAGVDEQFDLVLFMGVFYHLRYPTLALDTVSRLVRRLMIFQSLTMDADIARDNPPEVTPEPDYALDERHIFHRPGWPKMAFVELRYSGDTSNWWIPNHAGIVAMLRSTGFETVRRIAHETYLCKAPAQGIVQARGWDKQEWLSATGTGRAEPVARARHRTIKEPSSRKGNGK